VAQLFQREVADDLVGVHVGRGAGPALDDVDHELVEQLAFDEVLAGQDDGRCAVAVDGTQVGIGAGGGLFTKAIARTRSGMAEMRVPEMAKFSTARAVCTPQ
jgi:hypothetical protein